MTLEPGGADVEDDSWVPALDASQLQEQTITLVSPRGVSIILIKHDGQIYGVRNRCAHMGCTLAGGRLEGRTLQCPCHEWTFDITTGEFLAAREITLPTYACRTEDGQILIKLEAS